MRPPSRHAVVLTLAAAILATACNITIDPPSDTRVGSKAPDFTLPDLEGKPFSLSSYGGKVVLLDFWATWCPPCREEMPMFQELHNLYRERGFEVVGISLDENAADIVPGFLRDRNIRYTNLLSDARVEDLYGPIVGLPTHFIIDREGTIRRQFTGGGIATRGEIESTIRELL
jgi:peroxiredoxin